MQAPLAGETRRTDSYEACREERRRRLTCQHQLGHARGTLQRSPRRGVALRSNAPRATAVCPSARAVPLARPAESWRRGGPGCHGAAAWEVTATGRLRSGALPARRFPPRLRRAARPGPAGSPAVAPGCSQPVRNRRKASAPSAPGRRPTPREPYAPGQRSQRLQKASPKPRGLAPAWCPRPPECARGCAAPAGQAARLWDGGREAGTGCLWPRPGRILLTGAEGWQ